VVLDRDQAVVLRDAAAAHSGRSSAARDLSLLLDRALSGGQVIALRRAEAQLEPLAGDLELEMVAEITALPLPALSHSAPEH
jgi:hypothetical protein